MFLSSSFLYYTSCFTQSVQLFFSTLLQHFISKFQEIFLEYQNSQHHAPHLHLMSFCFKFNSYLLVRKAFSLNAHLPWQSWFHFTCNIRNLSDGRDAICRRRRVLPWQTLNANLHCTSVTLYHIRAKLLLKPITILFFFSFCVFYILCKTSPLSKFWYFASL
jgi:hypothetical protein